MAVDVRPCKDLQEFVRANFAIAQYFGMEPNEERAERFSKNLPFDRMHAAWEDDAIVGGAGAFPFELSVPGGNSVPCAGVTVVGVFPTHRRRGVLRAMMRAQLDDVRERGEPIAALWASEETIYGRFGYGIASFAGEISLAREYAAFALPLERCGTVRLVDLDQAKEPLRAVWDAARKEIPGIFSRSDNWWDYRILLDPPERREGGGPKRVAVVEIDGKPEAYGIYRHRMGFDAGVSSGKVEVIEALGSTPQATAELWRYLLDIDWAATITGWLLPIDHPLFFLLANPRRMKYRAGDGLWVRLVDVGAALSAREYAADRRIVLEVRDSFAEWNEGRWKLEGGECTRTGDDPDICLDVASLGSVYLGGFTFAQLRDAFRVEEMRPGAVAEADAMFRSSHAPWCPEIF